eukprot:CAMPEP_0117445530 /NCGR_PEP_ID=MMETSP0759-20121206/5846_1 /TAXON_ID=63605 /ORGANISM="Percolomonas cosmopolitus, Strain WS" /LENGTH=147 /DNA_ID=CAMNT_0005237715 /DNA_START=207 /DNA_END=650 /DNA_ORIENTATION=-
MGFWNWWKGSMWRVALILSCWNNCTTTNNNNNCTNTSTVATAPKYQIAKAPPQVQKPPTNVQFFCKSVLRGESSDWWERVTRIKWCDDSRKGSKSPDVQNSSLLNRNSSTSFLRNKCKASPRGLLQTQGNNAHNRAILRCFMTNVLS